MAQTYRKKLIEVALPLEAINVASSREKSIRHGHPSTLHLWWARRPLAAARAVIFAQMVDDPSSHPELFPTEKAQEKERQRLFRILENLVLWESTNNEKILNQAREEIWRSWRSACADNKNHPQAKELFNPDQLPGFHDPFAGGGALPLEAQRLGLESYASDLNPVAVLINKAMIEFPPKFAGKPPVNPDVRKEKMLFTKDWMRAQGLAEDVRYYGQWMRDEAEKRIGRLYPKVEITKEMIKERPDLKQYLGEKLTVIAWLWARTVKSPNPAFAKIDVPLISSYMLSSKGGKEAYVEPIIEDGSYYFKINVGKPNDLELTNLGTTAGKRNAFFCLMSGTPIDYDYIRKEGKAGHIGVRMMAIVAKGEHGRVYLPPTKEMEAIAISAKPSWKPDNVLPINPRDFKTPNYGLKTFGELFTSRQLVALSTLSDLVREARDKVKRDAISAGFIDDNKDLNAGGAGAMAYSDAVAVYLAFVIDKCSDYWSSVCSWNSPGEKMRNTFGRQAIPMVWDYAEANPFCHSTGNFMAMVDWTWKALETTPAFRSGFAQQADAQSQVISKNKIVSIDPPYYDNIGYADLSDFFYVWMRRALKTIFPDIFATVGVPKAEELVATPYRHGSKEKAEAFFLEGMTQAMRRLAEQAHSAFPVTIYYAFKQSESEGADGTSSTGWETFLDAVIQAGFAINGTWPMRTELSNRMIGSGTNALASSIILVCRPRKVNAPRTTRREFIASLKAELPLALTHLQRGNIAPVDLAQATIGPGMEIFTRYSKIMEADGSSMTVKMALGIINQMLDEVLSEQEGEFDPDTRWALAWFEQYGMDEGPFGDADNLSRAKNTAVNGLVEDGIIVARSGKVKLLKREELSDGWDPTADTRITAWEVTQHLIRSLEKEGGEQGAAELLRKLGDIGDAARDLAYRLYNICERKKWPQEALAYNSLVLAWPEITKLAQGISVAKPVEAEVTLFDQ